jgi:hypothetical protein
VFSRNSTIGQHNGPKHGWQRKQLFLQGGFVDECPALETVCARINMVSWVFA